MLAYGHAVENPSGDRFLTPQAVVIIFAKVTAVVFLGQIPARIVACSAALAASFTDSFKLLILVFHEIEVSSGFHVPDHFFLTICRARYPIKVIM
jgi:hypothetical protein